MATIKDLLQLALGEVGYLEKATNASLDSKTGNAGYNNYTKYAAEMDKIDGFYNGKKNGYSWCDVFVDWCMVKTFGVTEALRLLCQPTKSMGAGCDYSAGYYRAKGRWYTKPQVGDQIFFKSASYAYAHTGLVVDVTATQVITVEGNTSGGSTVISNGGGVCKKSYPIGYANIVGYGRPDWTAAEMADIQAAPAASKPKQILVSVQLPQLRFGDTGNYVESLQLLLNGKGYDCGKADGVWGEKTDVAVSKFQRDNKLTADKICGKDTWTKLLSV